MITATVADLDNVGCDEMFFRVLGCVGSFGSDILSFPRVSFPTVDFCDKFQTFDSGGSRMGLELLSL